MRLRSAFFSFGLLLAITLLFSKGAEAAAGPPAQMVLAAGDNQTAPANTRVTGPVCVLVTDAANVPVPGVSVTWGGISDGGSLVGATESTDPTGIATLGGWTLGPAAGINTITATSAGLPSVTFTATATDPVTDSNVVITWNKALLVSFQEQNTAPTVSARALGILHTSIFDAWAAFDPKAVGTQLGGTLRRPAAEQTAANKQVAISYAAYRTLVDLFPSEQSRYDAIMATLNLDPTNTSTDTTTPIGVGNVAAAANITFRHSDGANQLGDLNPGPYSDYTSYTPVNDTATINDASLWQPLLMPNGQPQIFTTPQWGLVKTFAIGNSTQRKHLFPKPPAKKGIKMYQTESQEILDLSAGLTDLTKTIAAYWVDKAGTVTPPGHWFVFAQFVSARDHHTLDDDVKLFFALGNAELDTSVECWDIKRRYDSVRPVTSIHFLFKGQSVKAWAGPGLGTQTIMGDTWKTYIPTPPFAEYISGHSSFSAAGAEILRTFTKSPKFGLSVNIPAGFVSIELNTPAQPLTFHWDNLIDAAGDAGMSRRYGGIHYKEGDLVGRKIGKNVASIAYKKAQQYISGKVKP